MAKNSLSFYYKHGWLPIVIMTVGYWLVYTILSFQGTTWKLSSWQIWFSLLISMLALLQAVISVIFQLYHKRYWLAMLQSILIVIGTLLAMIINGAIYEFSRPSDSVKDLSIPTNVKFDLPIQNPPCQGDCELYNPNFPTHTDKLPTQITRPDFFLYDGVQGGMYHYDVYLGKVEKGTVYLKAFEITHNTPLSADALAKTSEIVVDNPTTTLKKFELTQDFSIAKGDWYEYYGSRFELWFQPANGEPAYPLMHKNYIIQGWQR